MLSTRTTDTHGRWNILVLQPDFVVAKKHLLPIIDTLLSTVQIPPKYTINSTGSHSVTNSSDSDYSSLCSTIAKSITSNLTEDKYSHISTNINRPPATSTAWNTHDTISNISNPTIATSTENQQQKQLESQAEIITTLMQQVTTLTKAVQQLQHTVATGNVPPPEKTTKSQLQPSKSVVSPVPQMSKVLNEMLQRPLKITPAVDSNITTVPPSNVLQYLHSQSIQPKAT